METQKGYVPGTCSLNFPPMWLTEANNLQGQAHLKFFSVSNLIQYGRQAAKLKASESNWFQDELTIMIWQVILQQLEQPHIFQDGAPQPKSDPQAY